MTGCPGCREGKGSTSTEPSVSIHRDASRRSNRSRKRSTWECLTRVSTAADPSPDRSSREEDAVVHGLGRSVG